MARKKGSKDYPEEVKRRALHLYLEAGWSQEAIQAELGLRDPNRVRVWAGQYQREGEAFFARRRGRPPQARDQEAYIRQLEMENDLLKKFHAELRHKSPGKSNTG